MMGWVLIVCLLSAVVAMVSMEKEWEWLVWPSLAVCSTSLLIGLLWLVSLAW